MRHALSKRDTLSVVIENRMETSDMCATAPPWEEETSFAPSSQSRPNRIQRDRTSDNG
jgi:hypothetical protein